MVLKIRKKHLKSRSKTIINQLLHYLLIGGAIVLVMSNPYGVRRIMKELRKENKKKFTHRTIDNAFYQMKRQGLISVESRHGNTCISLSKKGRVAAEVYKVFQQKPIEYKGNWDGNWYLVLFDIGIEKKIVRDSIRFLLKRLGFCQLQKSVWVIPFNCRQEVKDLKNFFGLSDEEIRLLVSSDLGDMSKYKKFFNLA